MSTVTIHQGDVLAVLRTLPAGSVHCIVTSPPYYGLRDYGTATWVGGDPGCAHRARGPAGVASSTLAVGRATTNHQHEGYRQTCGKCGAIRQDNQIGLEATPQEYVARMVEVFEECRRVLRDDGTLWLNLGDSYASGKGTCYNPGGGAKSYIQEKERFPLDRGSMASLRTSGLKPKDLIGIPWRVAFALQDAGWYLRADIIWHKTAPMPESVMDRPTKAHEYVFLLSKSPRYFYDQTAVREPSTGQSGSATNFARETKDHLIPSQAAIQHRAERTPTADSGYRNQRDVWTLSPEPYPEAHFATFPTEIPRRAILAGTSARGVCPVCGAPWVRVVERKAMVINRSNNHPPELRTRTSGAMVSPAESTTTGWAATCNHDAAPVPAVVLDPFMGSGTTLAVARSLGRDGVGIELNPEYVELAHRRIYAETPALPGVFA